MSRLSVLFGTQMPDVRLNGPRVHLRPPERTDWSKWAELRGYSRDFLKPWEPTWPQDALSKAAFRRRLSRYASDWRDDLSYSFLIFRTEDAALLGGISLSNLRRGVSEMASVGYWMGSPHAGNGYMTEALSQLGSFAFERMRLHRLEAACLVSNQVSRKLLDKFGFQLEGYAKAYLFIDGSWRDHLLFGLGKEDWEMAARRNSGVPSVD